MREPEDTEIRNNYVQCRGIILKGNKVLVMFRRKNGREYYVFPGGHMRYGEKPIDTVVREIREETTIEVKNLELAFHFINHLKKEREDYYFVGNWVSGEPTLSGEEFKENDKNNYYEPILVEISDIEELELYPLFAKEWFIDWLERFLENS